MDVSQFGIRDADVHRKSTHAALESPLRSWHKEIPCRRKTMQQHVRRDIDLSPDMEERVNEAVSQGEYHSASEIVDEALRMWSEKRENFGYTLNELRTLVNAGIESG